MALLTFCMAPSFILAQFALDSTELWVNIDSIFISATRIENEWMQATRAISQRNTSRLRESNPQLSLQEYLQDVPGVFSMNNQNMAQDLRVSIRGFGSRANFGVRGLKLIVDGIPETTVDGQGQLDAIPLGFINNIEVIKGPSATLYGQASGGVISINTVSEYNYNLQDKPLIEARLLYGSYNTSQIQLNYGKKVGNSSYVFHANQSSSEGYRTKSGFLNRNLKARLDHRFSKFSKINVMIDFLSSPEGEDPGALNLEEAITNRRAARDRNEAFDTGETISNLKASVNYQLLASKNRTMDAYGFLTSRNFLGLLPFEVGGIVDLQRWYYGQGIAYTIKTNKKLFDATVKYGYDLANQVDNRIRFSNLLGQQGPIDLYNKEIIKNAGLYTLVDIDFGTLHINTGLRYDYNFFELKDELDFGKDNSGIQTFSNFSPSLGINYQLDDYSSIFANYSSGFDTPTFLELVNNPSKEFGLNNTISPQQSDSYELGFKMAVKKTYSMSLALFHISTSDELVPFSIDAQPDITFFRNAGGTVRRGLELEGHYVYNELWDVSLSYSLASFKYENFVVDDDDFTGNSLPGIPNHNASLRIGYSHPLGLKLNLNNRFVGKLFTSDSNVIYVESYFLSDLYASYDLMFREYSFQPFLGLQNLFNAAYFDNIRINGFANRHYEPAPGFNVFGGVRLRL